MIHDLLTLLHNPHPIPNAHLYIAFVVGVLVPVVCFLLILRDVVKGESDE